MILTDMRIMPARVEYFQHHYYLICAEAPMRKCAGFSSRTIKVLARRNASGRYFLLAQPHFTAAHIRYDYLYNAARCDDIYYIDLHLGLLGHTHWWLLIFIIIYHARYFMTPASPSPYSTRYFQYARHLALLNKRIPHLTSNVTMSGSHASPHGFIRPYYHLFPHDMLLVSCTYISFIL